MTRNQYIICPNCGSTHSPDDAFCSVCGTSLENAELVAVSVVAQSTTQTPTSAYPTSWTLLLTLGAVGMLITSIFSIATFVLVVSGYRWSPSPVLQAPAPSTVAQPATSEALAAGTASDHSQGTRAQEASAAGQAEVSDAATGAWAEKATTEVPSSCASWEDAGLLTGTYQCFCGTVTSTYQDPNSAAFFINFSRDRSAFYVVSFEHRWDDLEGRCIQVCGQVETYQGRPQIVIRNPDRQLLDCP